MTTRALIGLVVCIAVPVVSGMLGALFGMDSVGSWYRTIHKPALTPPSWLFGPVWTALYVMMGLAVWMVWLRFDAPLRSLAIGLFVLQLALNAAWTPIFFGQHRIGAAFAELVCLWVALVATTIVFWRVHRPAGLLLLPYLTWTSFAGWLNYAIWRLNA